MELVKPMLEYMLSIGPMMIPFKSLSNQEQVTENFKNCMIHGVPFVVDANGVQVIINPAPGMVLVVMTRDQFERNRGMQNLVKGN